MVQFALSYGFEVTEQGGAGRVASPPKIPRQGAESFEVRCDQLLDVSSLAHDRAQVNQVEAFIREYGKCWRCWCQMSSGKDGKVVLDESGLSFDELDPNRRSCWSSEKLRKTMSSYM